MKPVFWAMNPSSLEVDFSAVQRHKDMYKYAGSKLFDDEGSHAVAAAFTSGRRT